MVGGNPSALTVAASDGRTLMVAQWGDPDGFPVFSLHGTSGSRFARHYDESAYVEAGARVITYDRPGYGGSDRHRGRRVVDCVSDVALIAAEMLERMAADPSKVIGDEWQLSVADRAQLAVSERHEVIREMVTEAFRNGVWGIVDDMLCATKPWGFDVAEIRVPTRIKYGLSDVLVPRQHGEWLARNVPNAEVVIDEEGGHLADAARFAEHYSWLVEPT